MSLRLAVVTPSFQQAPYLEAAVRSVLQDAPAGLDYVVRDGGSTDGSLAVLQQFGGRLRFTSGPDGGQAAAVNAGWLEAAGDVVGWLNSDDLYAPGALRAALAFLEERPAVDLVYGEADLVDERGRATGRYPVEDWNPARLADVCYLCQPAVFLRRRVLDRHGLLDESLRYCMDYEYWLRVAPHVRAARLPRTLASSRIHAQTKTRAERVAVHAEIADMLRARLGHVPERWVYNYGFAVVDAAGFDRAQPDRYFLLLTRSTARAFLRWHGRLPASFVRTTLRWAGQALRRRRAGLLAPR